MAHYRLNQILPKTNLYDSVQVESDICRSWWRSYICPHTTLVPFTIIDHRSGPGWMSDTHQGECCVQCGYIATIRRTY